MRNHLASFVTALIFIVILWQIWERTRIVILVQVPWWGLVIALVVVFLVIDYVVSRLFRRP